MKIKYLLFAISIGVFLCCKTEDASEDADQRSADKQRPEITAKVIEGFEFEDYRLSNDAQQVVSNWGKFQELSTQISFLKKADLTFFTSEKDTLKVFLETLRTDIPETINTNPIHSRLSVLENTLLKLNNDLTLDNYSAENKLKSIKALLIANSDLIFLINKKLEYDKNNVVRPE